MKLDEIFEGSDLSDEFKEKLKTLFAESIKATKKKLKKEFKTKFEERLIAETGSYAKKLESLKSDKVDAVKEAIETTTEKLTQEFNESMKIAVQEWASENSPAITSNIQVEMAQSLMSDLKDLVESHNISVIKSPELVDVLENKLSESKAKSKKLKETINEMKLELIENKRADIIAEYCDDDELTETQQERLVVLAEDVTFVDKKSFSKKIGAFSNIVKGFVEDEDDDDPDNSDGDDNDNDSKKKKKDKSKVKTESLRDTFLSNM